MTGDAPTESGTLIRVQVMAAEFATSDTTDRVDEVRTVQVFETILIRIVRVGTTVEVVGQRVFPTFFITSIL